MLEVSLSEGHGGIHRFTPVFVWRMDDSTLIGQESLPFWELQHLKFAFVYDYGVIKGLFIMGECQIRNG
jgi:hypothetical protein